VRGKDCEADKDLGSIRLMERLVALLLAEHKLKGGYLAVMNMFMQHGFGLLLIADEKGIDDCKVLRADLF